jgi:hypothetical protein
MRLPLRTIGAIVMCFAAGMCLAQTQLQTSSLCNLQEKVGQGEHTKVRVSGVYSRGLENSTLDDPACPVVPYQSTWVDLALQSKQNQKKLDQLLDKSGRASVVFEGEFYGSPLPDPKLPESLQKGFPPHWGHLGCCRTKLVVHVIREVTVAPPDKHSATQTVVIDPKTGDLHFSIPVALTANAKQ